MLTKHWQLCSRFQHAFFESNFIQDKRIEFLVFVRFNFSYDFLTYLHLLYFLRVACMVCL